MFELQNCIRITDLGAAFPSSRSSNQATKQSSNQAIRSLDQRHCSANVIAFSKDNSTCKWYDGDVTTGWFAPPLEPDMCYCRRAETKHYQEIRSMTVGQRFPLARSPLASIPAHVVVGKYSFTRDKYWEFGNAAYHNRKEGPVAEKCECGKRGVCWKLVHVLCSSIQSILNYGFRKFTEVFDTSTSSKDCYFEDRESWRVFSVDERIQLTRGPGTRGSPVSESSWWSPQRDRKWYSLPLEMRNAKAGFSTTSLDHIWFSLKRTPTYDVRAD